MDFYPKSQNRENPFKLINLRGNLRNQFAQKLIQVLIKNLPYIIPHNHLYKIKSFAELLLFNEICYQILYI